MSSTHDSGRKFKAVIISIFIHSLLALGIGYATFTVVVPEGTVTSTKIEFEPAPQGNTTAPVEDGAQEVSLPPKSQTPVQDKSDVVAPMPAKKEVAKPEAKPEAKKEIVKALPAKLPTKKAEASEPGSAPALNAVEEISPREEPKLEELPQDDVETEKSEEETEEARHEIAAPPSDTEETAVGTPIAGDPAGDEEVRQGIANGVRSESELTPMAGNPIPTYPTMARIRRIQGTTQVRFLVDDSGNVTKAWIHNSSGHKPFDDVALETQLKWKYRPGRPGVYQKAWNFRLKGEAEEMPYRIRK